MRAVRAHNIQPCSCNLSSRSAARFPLLTTHYNHHGHSTTTRSSPSSKAQKWSLKDIAELSKTNASPIIFRSSSTNPYHNLSIEHFILQNTSPASRSLLFYVNDPCVVIGRNQNPWLECNFTKLRAGLPASPSSKQIKENIPVELVRRRSGGGGVFHDSGNLNYSVLVPNDKDFERRKHAEMVVRALQNIQDEYLPEVETVKVNDRNDIVMKRRDQKGTAEADNPWLKVSGSAFKLTKGRALHHGTLLYSSPYLSQISGLLRSPGAEMIHAKGVESVRSKVGNLAFTPDDSMRLKLRNAIILSVIKEFKKMYASHQHKREIIEIQVGDDDCSELTNPKICNGVQELLSNPWRFEQTPRFDFKSGPTSNGIELDLHVNHGVVENLKILLSKTGQKLNIDLVGQESRYKKELKIHQVGDWKTTIEEIVNQNIQGMDVEIPNELVRRLEEVFPRF